MEITSFQYRIYNVDGLLRKGIFLHEAIDWQRRDEELVEPFIDALADSHWFASLPRTPQPVHWS